MHFVSLGLQSLSECQTVWIQIRTDDIVSDLGPNYLTRLSADDNRVITIQIFGKCGVVTTGVGSAEAQGWGGGVL